MVDINASDKESGIRLFNYRKGNGIATNIENGRIGITEAGSYKFFLIDNAGNESRAVLNVYKAPTLSATIKKVNAADITVTDGMEVANEVSINVSGYDAKLYINGRERALTKEEGADKYNEIKVSAPGGYNIDVEDKFGVKRSLNFTIKESNVDPPEFILNSLGYVNENVGITIVYPEESIENTRMYQIYTYNEQTHQYDKAGEEINYESRFSVSQNCIIKAWYFNEFGIQSAIGETQVMNIDKDAPSISFISGENGVKILDSDGNNMLSSASSTFYTSASSVKFNCSDDINENANENSGVRSIRYSKDGMSDIPVSKSELPMTLNGEGSYKITVEDRAGNYTVKTINILKKPKVTKLEPLNGGVFSTESKRTKSDVKVTVEGADVKAYISNDNANQNIPEHAYTDEEVMLEANTYTVNYTSLVTSVKLEDKYGSVTTSENFSVDKRSPYNPVITLNPSLPTNDKINVTIDYTDKSYGFPSVNATYRIDYYDPSVEGDDKYVEGETITVDTSKGSKD